MMYHYHKTTLAAIFLALSMPGLSLATDTASIADFELQYHTEQTAQLEYATAAGDINGDSFADAVVVNAKGHVQVIFGKRNLQSANLNDAIDLEFVPPEDTVDNGDNLDIRLAVADINNDGISDLLFSVPGEEVNGQKESGRVYLEYGRTDLAGQITFEDMDANFVPENAGVEPYHGDALGIALTMFDFNNDGLNEMIMAANSNDAAGYYTGKVYVFPGTPTLYHDTINVTTAPLQYTGLTNGKTDEDDNQKAGTGLGGNLGSGDLNGDAVNDLVIFSSNSVGQDNYAGEVTVVLGKSQLPNGVFSIDDVATYSLQATEEFSRLGQDVIVVGDMNGDQHQDLMVSREYKDNNARALDIVFGPLPNTLGDTTPDVSLLDDDSAYLYLFGSSTGTMADLHNDNTPELLLGAADYGSEVGLSGYGAIYQINSDKNFPTSGTVAINNVITTRYVGNASTRNKLGGSISVADFNKDGTEDILVSGQGGCDCSKPWPMGTPNPWTYYPAHVAIDFGTVPTIENVVGLSNGRMQINQANGVAHKIKIFQRRKKPLVSLYTDDATTYVIASNRNKRLKVLNVAGDTLINTPIKANLLRHPLLRIVTMNDSPHILLIGEKNNKTTVLSFSFDPTMLTVKRDNTYTLNLIGVRDVDVTTNQLQLLDSSGQTVYTLTL